MPKAMNLKYFLLCAVAALFGAAQADAQGQDLFILSAHPDARTAAMGNANAATEGMHLYNNPAAFFAADKQVTADASAFVYPQDKEVGGTLGLYTATAGLRFAQRHAAFVGYRYAGGLKLKGFDIQGNPTKDYQPFDWTIDLGYAYQLGKGFAAYATGSVIFSHLSKNATGGAFTLGAAYRNTALQLAERPTQLTLDAKVAALGPQLDYGNGSRVALPTHLSVGGALSMELTEQHQLAAALTSRYFFQPADTKVFQLGGGLEYTYRHCVSLRAGYEYGSHQLSHFTAGAGVKVHGLRLNAGYMLKTTDQGGNYCTLGVGVDF